MTYGIVNACNIYNICLLFCGWVDGLIMFVKQRDISGVEAFCKRVVLIIWFIKYDPIVKGKL